MQVTLRNGEWSNVEKYHFYFNDPAKSSFTDGVKSFFIFLLEPLINQLSKSCDGSIDDYILKLTFGEFLKIISTWLVP
tara:strand:- start:67538 stop:67771 length:234 start_codon:yes stop_codon:yes gene_type:complete